MNYINVSTKDIDFNDFVDALNDFNDSLYKKSKRIRFENIEKNQMEFKSSLRSIKIGGNLSTAEKRVLNYIMDILK